MLGGEYVARLVGKAVTATPGAIAAIARAPFRSGSEPMDEVRWPGTRLQVTGEAGGARRLSQKTGEQMFIQRKFKSRGIAFATLVMASAGTFSLISGKPPWEYRPQVPTNLISTATFLGRAHAAIEFEALAPVNRSLVLMEHFISLAD